MRRLGLRARFILLILLLFVLLFAVATLVLVQQNTRTLRTNLNEQSWSFANLATKPIGDAFVLYKDSGRIRIGQQVTTFTDLDPDVKNVIVVDTQGKVLFNKTGASPKRLDGDIASSFKTLSLTNRQGQVQEIVSPYIEDFGVHRYSIIYSISNERLNKNISQVVTTIIIFSSVTLLLMILITYSLINRFFLKPVHEMSEEAIQISQGDFNRQIATKRKDEIGDLATAVNTMADALKADIAKLQEVDKLKTEFMMITSHNLRTPLTVVNGYIELLQSGTKLDEEQKKAFDAIAVNVRRLGTFTEDILTISNIEAGSNIMQLKPTELRPVLEQIAQEFMPIAAQKQLDFKVDIQLGNEQANISQSHFRSAIWNLLDNAQKFSAEKGSIVLAASRQGGQVAIAITDTGIGISPEELPKLFTKFHRGTSTLTYNYEGTGIGLYVTKLIIERHDGQIQVESKPGEGSTFTVSLPVISTTVADNSGNASPTDSK